MAGLCTEGLTHSEIHKLTTLQKLPCYWKEGL